MVTEIEYALMAGRAYQSTRSDINLFPTPVGWSEPLDKRQRDASTGFEAGYFQRGPEIVISYAGTNPNDGILPPGPDNTANIGLASGVGSVQLLQAAEYYLQVQATNPGATITFAGHSLGGGLAALMGVFFGKRAVTFDQAPFANSAELSVVPPDAAANLKADLLARGYSEGALQGLTDFLTLRAAMPMGEIPNTSLINSINVQGEFLSGVPYNILDRIGLSTSIPTNAPGVSGDDLHSHALLTAFLQSMQTALSGQTLNGVTFKLPDLLGMLFDENLYEHPTNDPNNRNFLERLVQNQTGNAMVTRFTSDLWKLAQDGGLTMTDGPTPATNLVSKALIAFAMQMYYENTANATTATKELFTPVTGGGGVEFDRADVAASLDDVKGYNDFHFYLVNNFSAADRQRIEDLLPVLRDWYVQAGAGGMNATDTQNRGAFMLGSYRADTLTGGSQTDLLVGNAGTDTLRGGGGNDTLFGGAGFDTYYYTTGDGHDRIEDSGADGVIKVNGQTLVGGIKKAGHTDWISPDGTIKYLMSGTDLVVQLNGTTILTVNEDFQSGQFGISLTDAPSIATDAPPTFRDIVGDFQPLDTDLVEAGVQIGYDDLGNVIQDPQSPGDRSDLLNGSGNNDQMNGGALRDRLTALGGSDVLTGGSDGDVLIGQDGNDQLFAEELVNVSSLVSFENFGGTVGTGAPGDFLTGGINDDVLVSGGATTRFMVERGKTSSWGARAMT